MNPSGRCGYAGRDGPYSFGSATIRSTLQRPRPGVHVRLARRRRLAVRGGDRSGSRSPRAAARRLADLAAEHRQRRVLGRGERDRQRRRSCRRRAGRSSAPARRAAAATASGSARRTPASARSRPRDPGSVRAAARRDGVVERDGVPNAGHSVAPERQQQRVVLERSPASVCTTRRSASSHLNASWRSSMPRSRAISSAGSGAPRVGERLAHPHRPVHELGWGRAS